MDRFVPDLLSGTMKTPLSTSTSSHCPKKIKQQHQQLIILLEYSMLLHFFVLMDGWMDGSQATINPTDAYENKR